MAEENMTPKHHEWTLLYHGAGKSFKGRGELIRLMFEDKKIEYSYSDENMYGPTGICDCFRGSADAIISEDKTISNPIFFPPAIWHRPTVGEEVLIN